MKKKTVSIQVDDSLYNYIKKLSDDEGLSISAYIRRLLLGILRKGINNE